MQRHTTPSVGLIVSSDSALAEHLVHELRTLHWIAMSVDRCDTALEMMEAVDFSLVIVDVVAWADWLVCQRLVDAGRSTVAIVTTFIIRILRQRP